MSDEIPHKFLDQNGPLAALRHDNFTPAQRTPWGGRKISALKEKLGVSPRFIGESWEMSFGPEFPSILEADDQSVRDLLADDPRWLGDSPPTLLLKLLDAADNLSLQIHPRDDDTSLADDESGKPEAWYIIDAEPGAGLYLGFRNGVDEISVRNALHNESDLSELLYFHEVQPGDVFRIDAGTPHAIGRGVTLVEPQRIAPGRRGLTYRYWDWNRRYDEDGNRDDNGQGRPLHVEDALRVTAWDLPRESALIDQISAHFAIRNSDELHFEHLIGPGAVLRSDWLQFDRITGNGDIQLPSHGFCAITVLDGSLRVGQTLLRRGESGILAANDSGSTLTVHDVHLTIASAIR